MITILKKEATVYVMVENSLDAKDYENLILV